MIDFSIIDETYSDNSITNIINTYHVNRDWMGREEEGLTKQIVELQNIRKTLVYPTELEHFIKPIVDLVVIPRYTISTFYLVKHKSNAYRINFFDGRTALFYSSVRWGDLCISGKDVCEMTEQELSDAVNDWHPIDSDPQIPKEMEIQYRSE